MTVPDSIRQWLHEFVVSTPGRGFHELTDDVSAWVAGCGIGHGLLTLQVAHTSASLLIQENADPEVRRDLERFFARLVPDGDRMFRHDSEGPDKLPWRGQLRCPHLQPRAVRAPRHPESCMITVTRLSSRKGTLHSIPGMANLRCDIWHTCAEWYFGYRWRLVKKRSVSRPVGRAGVAAERPPCSR